MKTLAVTGGIGSGKSVVCRYLESKGIPVYDSDSRTRRLYDFYPELLKRVEEEFGCEFRAENGFLDRKKLAAVVFGDKSALALLESIVHPYAYNDFVDWRRTRPSGTELVVIESAIILQKPLFRPLADKIIMVEAPFEDRIRRVCMRDGVDREAVIKRMEAQNYDMQSVDAVILNDCDEQTLKARVDEVLGVIWNK